MISSEFNILPNSLATSGEAPSAAASEVSSSNNVKAAVSVIMLLVEIFFLTKQFFADRTKAIESQVDARKDQIERLGGIISNLDNWGSLPDYETKISKTDELFLNGVIISDSKSDLCDFCAFKIAGSDKVLYAPFPPEVLGGDPVDNTLYYVKSKDKYLFYNEDSKAFLEVSSPLPFKSKTTPGNDFSEFDPGDLVYDESTKTYYRVTNDGTGAEVQNYPLQKFISNPAGDRINDLQNRIRLRLNAIQNLSKGDGLDLQTIAGQLNSTLTALSALVSSLATALNSLARNIT